MRSKHDGDHAPPHLLLSMLRRWRVVLNLCFCFSLSFFIESFLKYFLSKFHVRFLSPKFELHFAVKTVTKITKWRIFSLCSNSETSTLNSPLLYQHMQKHELPQHLQIVAVNMLSEWLKQWYLTLWFDSGLKIFFMTIFYVTEILRKFFKNFQCLI